MFFKALTACSGTAPALKFKQITINYKQLIKHAKSVKVSLKNIQREDRVGILCSRDLSYVSSLLGIWASGGIAVPLATTHPISEQLYYLQNSKTSTLLFSNNHQDRAKELCKQLKIELKNVDSILNQSEPSTNSIELDNELNDVDQNLGALIMYTSGTTGHPKGVVHTHKSIFSQINSLKTAWHYNSNDQILHVLPLHHIHGIINVLVTTLYSHGCVELVEKFDPVVVWNRLKSMDDPVNVFMAVPTIYSKLLHQLPDGDNHLRNLRLCISGSASLPISIKKEWADITGQVLLERYGMTEIGMGLSCGMDTLHRIDNSVGWPLPGVTVKLCDETGKEVQMGEDGEIWVASDNLFKEYFENAKATNADIVVDENNIRWFKTGDVAYQNPNQENAYFIKGRNSVDIIKSGGYKLSALEIERHILTVPGIKECAVIGVPDEEWGQRVAVIVSTYPNHAISLDDIRNGLKDELATYKLPTLIQSLADGIPRNAMGKVNKKDLLKQFKSE